VSLATILAATIAQLERASVPYMITGSVASSYHGEPRATRDLDIVIDPDPGGITRLVGELEWAGVGGPDRQLHDVAAMLDVGGDALDLAYVERWVAVLGLDTALSRVRELRSAG